MLSSHGIRRVVSRLLHLAGFRCGTPVDEVPEGSGQGTSAGLEMLGDAPGIVLGKAKEGPASHIAHDPVAVVQPFGQFGEEIRGAPGKPGTDRTE